MMILHVFRAHAAALMTIVAVSVSNAQMTANGGGYDESFAREHAITKALPIYPADAIQRGETGVVQAKIGLNEQGQVVKIKMNQNFDPALRQAVADAVDQWTFNFEFKHCWSGGNICLSRLTFNFSIVNGQPRVELYTPEPGAKDSDKLGYWDSLKERSAWNHFEEVIPTRTKQQQ